jgi:6-pyruvoyltetrahydropterin/6-carboxytetrahydropterin synthase
VVSKDEHRFSCAHMTLFPDGTKERLHGHNFQLSVAVDLPAFETSAMLDFGRVKGVLSELCEQLREHVLLPGSSRALRVLRSDAREVELEICSKRYVLPADEVILLPVENVVVETLAAHLWGEVARRLAPELERARARSLEVTVTEAAGQGASCAGALR